MDKEIECGGCSCLSDSGGQGSFMYCGHVYFKDKPIYSECIVGWAHQDPRRVVSDKCPKVKECRNTLRQYIKTFKRE